MIQVFPVKYLVLSAAIHYGFTFLYSVFYSEHAPGPADTVFKAWKVEYNIPGREEPV